MITLSLNSRVNVHQPNDKLLASGSLSLSLSLSLLTLTMVTSESWLLTVELSVDIDNGYIGELVAHGGTISRAREGHDSLSTLATLGDRKS